MRLGVPSDKKWTLVDMRTYSPDPFLTEVRIYIDASLRHALASYPMNNRFVYNEEIPGGTEILIIGYTEATQGDWIKMTLVIDEHD
jgi:hypothetical protein